MNPLFSIIIPTWNNLDDLVPCVNSICRTGVLSGLGELIIVNNGDFPLTEQFKHLTNVKVLDVGENLGWEKGLLKGLEHTNAPYICFQNDDTIIPPANRNFYNQLLYPFRDPDVAAVGPNTTVAAGRHSIFSKNTALGIEEVSYLIFFTVMLDRKAYDLAGGIDVSAPGGDDLDLSIRLRKLGKKLVINSEAFLIHHGFRSGSRLRGDHTKFNGWNSPEMKDTTNQWLIQKHGFRTFTETQWGVIQKRESNFIPDSEGNAIRLVVEKGATVIELGCGGQKTIPESIGIDRVPRGTLIPHVGQVSVADIVQDVDKPLPEELKGKHDVVIARHILEHCVDTIATIKEWGSLLKEGGKLIIAVPNENIAKSIPMNPEHVHAFTPDSLKAIMELCGFSFVEWIDPLNGVSFIGVYQKPCVTTKTITSNYTEACLA